MTLTPPQLYRLLVNARRFKFIRKSITDTRKLPTLDQSKGPPVIYLQW